MRRRDLLTVIAIAVALDASCIVGEIESDACGAGQFAVIRCP